MTLSTRFVQHVWQQTSLENDRWTSMNHLHEDQRLFPLSIHPDQHSPKKKRIGTISKAIRLIMSLGIVQSFGKSQWQMSSAHPSSFVHHQSISIKSKCPHSSWTSTNAFSSFVSTFERWFAGSTFDEEQQMIEHSISHDDEQLSNPFFILFIWKRQRKYPRRIRSSVEPIEMAMDLNLSSKQSTIDEHIEQWFLHHSKNLFLVPLCFVQLCCSGFFSIRLMNIDSESIRKNSLSSLCWKPPRRYNSTIISFSITQKTNRGNWPVSDRWSVHPDHHQRISISSTFLSPLREKVFLSFG